MILPRAARRGAAPRAAATALLAVVVLGGASCEPIEPRPLVKAPMNRCPCEGFAPGASAALCSSRNRCEVLTAGGRPEFPFWIVVHVPDTSVYAPGYTYVLASEAFDATLPSGVVTRCQPSSRCLLIGGLGVSSGGYRVKAETSRSLGYPLPEQASVPVRVVHEPLGIDQSGSPLTFPTLPLGVLFASSRIANNDVEFSRALPYGRYRRVLYPQPPFDAVFPPVTDELTMGSQFLPDTITLGDSKLVDDAGGTSRDATVKRADGLDGWRVWLVDRPSQRRISVVRTLSGSEAKVTLHTAGEQRTETGGLGDDVEAVVAPPETWTAVPRYVTRLFGGLGLGNLNYPVIPPPVAVAGVVAQPTANPSDPLFGYSARVRFESQEIATNNESSTLLRYATTLNTDDRGRFATVLPPGTYAATIEPAEGTGFARRKEVVVIDRALTALRFQPPPRTLVKGRAVVTDGRPLAEAEVIAIPANTAPNPLFAVPRPGRTHTAEDGRFAFELDPGPYVLSVVPKPGTGFPRVVIRPDVPGSLTAQETELADIRVPAPSRLAFTLRAPTQTENPIKDAVVRIFATPGAGTPNGAPAADPVEIGSAMTDSDGAVEILLAQEPR